MCRYSVEANKVHVLFLNRRDNWELVVWIQLINIPIQIGGMINIANVITILRWSTNILPIIRYEMGQLILYRPVCCINHNGENTEYGEDIHAIERIYVQSILRIQCFLQTFHDDVKWMVLSANMQSLWSHGLLWIARILNSTLPLKKSPAYLEFLSTPDVTARDSNCDSEQEPNSIS